MTPPEHEQVNDARYFALMTVLAHQPLPLQLALTVGLWGRICGERASLRAQGTLQEQAEIDALWVTRMIPVGDFFLDHMRILLHADDYRAALQAFDQAIATKLEEVRGMREVDQR